MHRESSSRMSHETLVAPLRGVECPRRRHSWARGGSRDEQAMSDRGVDVTEQAGTAKAWGGRFAEAPDRRLEAFNSSVAFDVRMVREDIRGSIAHARMLGKQG